MILPNQHILTFLKYAVREHRVVLDYTKTDAIFNRDYHMTKAEARAMINMLERQVMNCEKDLANGTNQLQAQFIMEQREEEIRKLQKAKNTETQEK